MKRHNICVDSSTAYRPEVPEYLVNMQQSHRERGTTPGNPKWYKPPKMPKPIAPDLSMRLPSLVSLGCHPVSNESHRAWIFNRGGIGPEGWRYRDNTGNPKLNADDPKAYVKAWDELNGLTPCAIEWVKPSFHAA